MAASSLRIRGSRAIGQSGGPDFEIQKCIERYIALGHLKAHTDRDNGGGVPQGGRTRYSANSDEI